MTAEAWIDRAARVSPLLGYARGRRGGETGVVEKLFSILPERAGFAVEFGQRAFGRGTLAAFLADRGWGALYMDREAESALETRPSANGRTITLARESAGPSNINDLFERHGVPEDLDCLLIDIDGLDYWVWDAIDDRYAPSLVIIEFNAHVAADVRATIKADESWEYKRTKDYGASLAALEALATAKHYRLVHIHGCWNLYFVREDAAIPPELELRTPLAKADLALVADTEGFYDCLCEGSRPSWFGTPDPDVSASPWEIPAGPVESTEVDVEGISIEVMARGGDATWYGARGSFEEKESRLYPLVREAGFANFVDVGANVGLISIIAALRCPGVGIVALEADPRLVQLLRRNFERHGLGSAHVLNAVAGEEERPSHGFSLNPRGTLDNRVDVESWPEVRVPMVRVDRALARLEVTGPTFFKIDTQGFERQVLAGMSAHLERSSDWMIKVEFAPAWLGSQGTDAADLLAELIDRYEVAELPSRISYEAPSLDSLFSTSIPLDRTKEFVEHVVALDRDGRGWVDLLIRPA